MNQQTTRTIVAALAAFVVCTTLANAQEKPQSAADAKSPATITHATTRTVTRESAGTVAPNAAPAKSNMPTEITIQREVFDYAGTGRRDPYRSLMNTSDVRPLLSDLHLTAVILDVTGDNSVAILRDTFSKQQYRIRVGQQLGRLRVSAIKQHAVQFSVEEFGFNRTETLQISRDTTKVRNP